MSDQLSASEAVYGFAAWLTCRKEKVVLSSTDDAATIAALVGEFYDVNKLSKPREGWEKNLRHPSDGQSQQATPEQATPEQATPGCLHKDEIIAYAKDVEKHQKPWLLWSFKGVNDPIWHPCLRHPDWKEYMVYRRNVEIPSMPSVIAFETNYRNLLDALKDVCQTLAWHQFGECRGFSERLLNASEAIDMAKSVLGLDHSIVFENIKEDINQLADGSKPSWIPLTESMPITGVEVDVTDGVHKTSTFRWVNSNGENSWGLSWKPTHWRPMA